MLKICVALIFLVISFNPGIYSQSKKQPFSQSNPNLTFNNYISGVLGASFSFEDYIQEKIDKGELPLLTTVLKEYVGKWGIETCLFSSSSKNEYQNYIKSDCDFTNVNFKFTPDENGKYIALITFTSCNYDRFTFKSNPTIDINDSIWHIQLRTELNLLVPQKKIVYNKNERLKLPAQKTQWTEKLLKDTYEQKNDYYIEGIWERFKTGADEIADVKYKIGIVKKNKYEYDIIYLSGAINTEDWEESEIKGHIKRTAHSNLNKVTWLTAYKDTDDNAYCNIDDQGLLTFVYPTANNANKENKYIKVWPIDNPDENAGTGSGLIISKSGYVLTAHHVIKDGKEFKLIAQKGDAKESYKLIHIGSDAQNDLAILKLEDPNFPIPDIPFSYKSSQADVGDEVFVLGYPYTNYMGTELKVTSGIISSRSGLSGDITKYQLSAGVQPGNSGGPLFNKDGNLIGVITSKFRYAEFVNYAIKSTLLNNLFGSLDIPPISQETNSLSGKSLSEQIKILKKFVYIIEVK